MSALGNRWGMYLPLAGFLLMAALFLLGFYLKDPHQLPSALIDRAMPEFALPALLDERRLLSENDLKGRVLLLNVWATWCPTCKAEHAELMRLKQQFGVEIVGVVYKDDSDKARRWLEDYGNPYTFNIVDKQGKLGIDLGVYGAPETFLLDASATIRYKRVGDVNARVWRDELQPRLAALGSQP